MDIWLLRVVFAGVLIVCSFYMNPLQLTIPYRLVVGLALAAAIILAEIRLRRSSLKTLIGACIGSIAGIIGASLISSIIGRLALERSLMNFGQILTLLLMAYVGLLVGASKGEFLDLSVLGGLFTEKGVKKSNKILDTSVIIDGRVADLVETGFLEGTIVIPQFVLRELQQIADSADSIRRNRGRRGLDILQKIQKKSGVVVQISEKDFPDVKEVDLKLIELAKLIGAKIVTNDFNLNKVARLQGVGVLNINELANALKPVVLPGETMKVFILKEGKEYNQGVAYLDDGTMVVVDNARRMIGKNIDTLVTSVLQTTAGKMIFGRLLEDQDEDGSPPPRNDRKNLDDDKVRSTRY
ncbi:MAG: PIN domain nuclease [Acidobacteria bacterium]|nr:PIN domain nuclease [Acidobacteriota bacterium]